MDCLKNYTYFYPHFNIQNVIKKYNFAISKKKRQKRRAKTIGSEKGKKVKGFYLSSKNELNSQNLLSWIYILNWIMLILNEISILFLLMPMYKKDHRFKNCKKISFF